MKNAFLGIFLLILMGCQSNKSVSLNSPARSVAANENDSEFEDSFANRYEEFSNNVKNSSSKSDFAELARVVIEEDKIRYTLTRSFFHLFQFDEQLNEIHRTCMDMRQSNPNSDCSDPMESNAYRKLLIYRSINERAQRDLYISICDYLILPTTRALMSTLKTIAVLTEHFSLPPMIKWKNSVREQKSIMSREMPVG